MSINVLRLDDNNRASIINPDLPEPSSFTGRNFIELAFPLEYFKKEAKS